jgi:LmbE family N-acetylglucosaminyl deacetylase
MTATNQRAVPELTGLVTHRFLSPHYDDIALSCGGTAALLAQHGLTPEIRVACGAEPDPAASLTPFAADQHRRGGFAAGQAIEQRRREEAAAAALLGAISTCLSFPDAIYRGSAYQSDAQLFGKVAAADAAIPTAIVAEFNDASDDRATTRFYVPLGVGNHVDHQVCFTAGLDLAASGWDVWFYEDLPYALTPGAVQARLDQIAAAWPATAPAALQSARLAPVARVNITDTWETKMAAILAYPSQIAGIFRAVSPDGEIGPIEEAMFDYAMRAGDGFPAEQIWHLAITDAPTGTHENIG